MAKASIRYESAGGVATIALDRPDERNMFTPIMGDELWDAYSQAAEDPDVLVILMVGSGPVFCGGVDLAMIAEPEQRQRFAESRFFEQFPAALYECSKPSICAINGHAMGVGVTMTLPFDIRIIADDVRLTMPFIQLGILPGLGGSWLLPRLIGRSRTLELLYTGRAVLGSEAADIGLVEQAVPAAQVVPTARKIAETIAESDPLVVEYTKRLVSKSTSTGIQGGLEIERRFFAGLQAAKEERSRGSGADS